MAHNQVVVAIPVHKTKLNDFERLSLSRCVAVLGAHPLVLVAPDSLDCHDYLVLAPSAQVQRFDDRFFSSISGYNELLTSGIFYERFTDFESLLIYQLDALVFEDRLADWCGRGYDYVGAPWRHLGRWLGVGNGGLSLRNVASSLRVLRSTRNEDAAAYWSFFCDWTTSPWRRAMQYPHKLALQMGIGGSVQSFLKRWVRRGEPEDMFWGLHATRFDPTFRVAPCEEALEFAVEGDLDVVGPVVAQHPPFGCHREWFVKALHRYLHAVDEPQNDIERLIWIFARHSGLSQGGALAL